MVLEREVHLVLTGFLSFRVSFLFSFCFFFVFLHFVSVGSTPVLDEELRRFFGRQQSILFLEMPDIIDWVHINHRASDLVVCTLNCAFAISAIHASFWWVWP